MRNLVFALLAVNILFFLWPKESQEAREPLSRGKNQLPLLIQLVEVDVRPEFSSLVPEKFIPIVQPPPSTVRVPVPKPKLARIKVPVPEVEVQQAVNEVEVPPATEEVPAAVEPVATLDNEVATLPDLAEAMEDSNLQSCYTLGPFADTKSVNAAIADLSAMGATTTQREAIERRTRGYWVYLPSQNSRQEALAKADSLAANGFSDYFVVADGKHDNAISLGLFTLKKGSERRVKKLKSMGFDAQVEVRFTELSIYWLDYEASAEVDWDGYLKEKFPKGRIDLLKRSCT